MAVSVRLMLPTDVPALFAGGGDTTSFDLSGRMDAAAALPDEGRLQDEPGGDASRDGARGAARDGARARALRLEERRAQFFARWQSLLFRDTVWPAVIVENGDVAGSVVCAVLGDQLWLTGSLLPRFRGRGLLFESLTSALSVMTVRPVHVRLRASAPSRLVDVFARVGFRRVEVIGTGTGTGAGGAVEEIHRLDFASG